MYPEFRSYFRMVYDYKGIVIDEVEFKSIQFAIDTNIFSEYEEQSLQEAINIFEKNTGLKLNYEKSNVYGIGSSRKSNAKLFTTKKLHWSNDSIKVLGIDIHYDNEEMIRMNYNGITQKVKDKLAEW